ncbi:MAG: hypothetical protein Q4F21_00890 [Lachnospiraceae bacterium]|nr:hypothetical protein [Lachnospiraceae bacterium]
MDGVKNKIRQLLAAQEVRITAALQLILCVLAVTAAVKREFRTNQKKRRKAARKK